LKESKEREKAVAKLREAQEEKNKKLLEWLEAQEDYNGDTAYYSEADMIRHEIKFISELIWGLKVKDKETREALVEDLEKSMNWRINRLLWKTHEYKLDNIVYEDAYTTEDLYRAENRWIECFENLPTKLAEELKVKEGQIEEVKDAEIQEQLDALSSLEVEGL
jgi:hypothetical protein